MRPDMRHLLFVHLTPFYIQRVLNNIPCIPVNNGFVAIMDNLLIKTRVPRAQSPENTVFLVQVYVSEQLLLLICFLNPSDRLLKS